MVEYELNGHLYLMYVVQCACGHVLVLAGGGVGTGWWAIPNICNRVHVWPCTGTSWWWSMNWMGSIPNVCSTVHVWPHTDTSWWWSENWMVVYT